MKLPFSISRRAARMLVILLLGGVAMIQAIAGAKAAGEVGSESYAGTLTLIDANSYLVGTRATGGTATLTDSNISSGFTFVGDNTLATGGTISLTVFGGSTDSMLNLRDVKTVMNSNGSLALTTDGVEFSDLTGSISSNLAGLISSNENSAYVVGGSVMSRVDGYDLVTFTNGRVVSITQNGRPVAITRNLTFTSVNGGTEMVSINGGSPIPVSSSGTVAVTELTGVLGGTTALPSTTGAAIVADGNSISLVDGAKVTFTPAHAITLIDNGTATLADGSTLALPAGSAILPGVNSQYTLANDGGTFTLAPNSTVVLANNGGTLTFTTGSTLRLGGGGTFTVTGKVTTPTVSSGAALAGSVDGLHFKADADGGVKKVKATVSLTNNLDTVLHHVTATVYLSDDAALSSDDVKLVTLKLADFVAKGKIGKHKTLSMPLSQKVPSILASYLEGKYLIVTLDAKDLDASAAQEPIVIGPITLP